MSPISATALSGMNAAQTGLQAAAHNIANLGTTGFRREQARLSADPSGGVSSSLVQSPEVGDALETDAVGLLQAKNAFLANLAVFKTSERMTGALLDVTG